MLAPFEAGAEVSFPRTLPECDIYLFAGITGDFSPNHAGEAFMQGTAYGRRIAYGTLIAGYMSRARAARGRRNPLRR